MKPTPEQMLENFNKFRALCERTGDRAPAILSMLDSIGESLAVCPASGRLDYHCAWDGGLVEHSLRVLSNANTLVKAYNHQLSRESLIIGCLFHDLGKVGHVNPDNTVTPYYLPQDSQWHREKLGEMYKHNPDIPYMSVPLRGLHILQHFGVKLTYEEYLSIYLNDGFILQENKAYCLKEPTLAHVVMTADYISTAHEKSQVKSSKNHE